MHILFGLLGTTLGALIVWKSEWIYRTFGPVAAADKYLGFEGGTRLMWKLVGLVVIFMSWLYMTGDIKFSPDEVITTPVGTEELSPQ
jgi:hypothetical protein